MCVCVVCCIFNRSEVRLILHRDVKLKPFYINILMMDLLCWLHTIHIFIAES